MRIVTSRALSRRRIGMWTSLALAALLTSCGGTSTAPTPSVRSITITGVGTTAIVGQIANLVATASLSDGSSANVTTQCAWESSNTAVATVSTAGVATFRAVGEVDFKATYNGVSGSMHVSAASPALYTLTGAVTDGANGQPLGGVGVQVVDGPNAGRSTQTGGDGVYTLTGLQSGSFTIQFTRTSYLTVSQPVTLSADARVDVKLNHVPPDVSGNFGTFNITLTVTQQTCEFPVTPGPTGTMVLDGASDGSNFTAKVTERGVSRTYVGSMTEDGSFGGFFSGLLPGFASRLPQHDASGTIQGQVSGQTVTATETLTYGAPCPGKIIDIAISGKK